MFNNLIPWHKKHENVTVRRDQQPLFDMHREMDRLFDNFFGGTLPSWSTLHAGGMFNPKFDVTENDQGIEFTVELSGVEEKDLDVSIANNLLYIKGEKKESGDENHKHYHISERRYGSFERSFALPEDVDLAKVTAVFTNGVLKVTLPKRPEANTARRKIEVKAA